MSQQVRDFVDRFSEAVNSGNLDVVDDLFGEDYIEHEEIPGISSDREGVKQLFGMFRESFDGFRITVEQVIEEGDCAAFRTTLRGTHSGDFMGVPASGEEIEASVIEIMRFADGKAVERWGVTDTMAIMEQIGAIPG